MRVQFKTVALRKLAYDPGYTGGFSAQLVRAYRMRVNFIESATSRMDLYAFTSLWLEKLKGKRKHQHSIRLNQQYRLIVEFKPTESGETVAIISIEDYH